MGQAQQCRASYVISHKEILVNENNGFATSSILLSFLAGGLTGAAIALLFAPGSGQETRAFIDQKVRDQVERAREGTERMAAKGQDMIEGATGYFDKQKKDLTREKNRVVSAVEAGRQAYRDGEQRTT
jgi:gas vesicle protein